MKATAFALFASINLLCAADTPTIKATAADVPYGDPANPRQKVDIYSPAGAKGLPVIFWIHGGGWQGGDRTLIQLKPQAFVEKGFVFVSTGYRLLPEVDMVTIFRDIAKSLGWVHKNIAKHGGDPTRIIVGGHSAGAQLAALICIDDRYLKAEGVPFSVLKGCFPVDGDTYDVAEAGSSREVRQHAGAASRILRRHARGQGQGHSAVPDPPRRRSPGQHDAGAPPRGRAQGRGHSGQGLRREGDEPSQDQ
ncbi:MAG: hypothetical protein EBT61_08555 [Verrucomicrobia bacterium]|nr:hypothetical protein [Verrucomicrobiota bacterium]